jgi:hypothetical protein
MVDRWEGEIFWETENVFLPFGTVPAFPVIPLFYIVDRFTRRAGDVESYARKK